ncbi:inositol oxygenase family protein [Tamlana sp. 2201CG12-4]|uniref:inositol oxygenase family protein n=1 Tax=Tamlana sp. 2201CG12-4 TaxID=3112582 RepID=UPI002DBD19E9|nr:inositol oxygenase family protein [Tamlana sp. 2201CG12-4]MEC3908502.1 inositol oxygenase family protein [Tamlana sp. 2201CG12-4]
MATPAKEKKDFRNYDQGEIIAAVKEHYRKMRTRQTLDYVKRMKVKYLTYDKSMHIWDAMEKLNDLIDVSDPDITLPNVHHLVQSAEAMREEGRPDWMQLVGLIHDLGKVMYLWGSDDDGTSQAEQWGLVGDIFVVGAKFPETCVYPEFNRLNSDMQDERYNTDLGVYEEGCGLDNLHLAWGHDEYLYQVLKNHPDNKIPEAGMVMLRYHSFYPWHTGNSYGQFLTEKDKQYKVWVIDFNKYDLYTKREETFNPDKIKAYYQPIIEKYLGPEKINW